MPPGGCVAHRGCTGAPGPYSGGAGLGNHGVGMRKDRWIAGIQVRICVPAGQVAGMECGQLAGLQVDDAGCRWVTWEASGMRVL